MRYLSAISYSVSSTWDLIPDSRRLRTYPRMQRILTDLLVKSFRAFLNSLTQSYQASHRSYQSRNLLLIL